MISAAKTTKAMMIDVIVVFFVKCAVYSEYKYFCKIYLKKKLKQVYRLSFTTE